MACPDDTDTLAVVMEAPGKLALRHLALLPAGEDDLVVDVQWSGISTGTERLLWTGAMPQFPGMGYPLVPGYESVGRVVGAGNAAQTRLGELVFVPGSKGFRDARGLFGGAARRVVVPGARALPIGRDLQEDEAALLALAATAAHALAGGKLPELIIGHGVLGRLLARLTVAGGGAPVVWEARPGRAGGARGYTVCAAEDDPRRDYSVICDASGDAGILDTLIGRLARGGEIVLAGFYDKSLHFAFPPAFMREARLRIASEWQPADLQHVLDLIARGALPLDGLITHRMKAGDADAAYRIAFGDPDCLKMLLDWRECA